MRKVELEKKYSLARKLFHSLLQFRSSFRESVSLQEEAVHVSVPRNSYYVNPKEIRIALLEAERRRAEALMVHRRNVVC